MEGLSGDKRRKPARERKLPPLKIQEAIKQENVPMLRAAGLKGALKTNEIKRNKADAQEYWDEQSQLKAEKEAQARLEETNEHIVPIDPETEDA